jgi:hypothetical protein
MTEEFDSTLLLRHNLSEPGFFAGFITQHSRKSEFTYLNVEAPAWQSAKVQEYFDISSFRNAARQDASAHKNVKVFFREPLYGGCA